MKNLVVIGAGPAGLACAYECLRLAKSKNEKLKVTVLDSAKEAGGLSASFELWDMLVDYGPHRFFTMDKKVADFWQQFAGTEVSRVARLTRIYYDRKFYAYPLKPLNAFLNLGPWGSFLCGLSYLKACLRPKGEDKTFEEWVSRRFGKRLYEMFFKTYSEKLWGIPCTELDADFAAQRIKGLNLFEAVLSAFRGNKGNKHKTLVDEFVYPDFGCGQVYNAMADGIEKLGGKLKLGVAVRGIKSSDGRVQSVVLES